MSETTQHTSTCKTVLTTGQVARICHVAARTVTKWFDTGKLRGYRIPGSRDRRIPMDQLVAFMKENDMPTDALDGAARKVLIFDPEISPAVSDKFSSMKNYEIRTAATRFDAGMSVREILPNVIVIAVTNGMTTCKAVEIARSIRDHALLRSAKLFAAVTNLTPRKRDKLLSNGFDRCLGSPYTAFELAEVIEDTMDLVT
ncbi:MAG: helix-turn-helix domain-containing protein [Phycisphaerae bacterium]|nr:helix-turn-helix domain-containing protein [Phycisphaerae bacterium]